MTDSDVADWPAPEIVREIRGWIVIRDAHPVRDWASGGGISSWTQLYRVRRHDDDHDVCFDNFDEAVDYAERMAQQDDQGEQ